MIELDKDVRPFSGGVSKTAFMCEACDVTFRTDGHPGRCFMCGRFARCTSCVAADCTCHHMRQCGRKATRSATAWAEALGAISGAWTEGVSR